MEIKAKSRDLTGKKVKTLRKQGLIPASVCSKKTSKSNKDSISIQIDSIEFSKVYKAAGGTSLVTITIDDSNKMKALISQVQKHPVSLKPIHVGFYQVDLTEKIHAEVPVELIGVEENELVKDGEAVIIQIIKTVNVECLPQDIPSHFEVTVESLKQVGDVITLTQGIKVDENIIKLLDVQLVVEEGESIIDPILAKADFAHQLEVETEGPTDVSQVETTEQGAATEEVGDEEGDKSHKDNGND